MHAAFPKLSSKDQKSDSSYRYHNAQEKNKPIITGRTGLQDGAVRLRGVVVGQDFGALGIFVDIIRGENRRWMGPAGKSQIAFITVSGDCVAEDDKGK